MPYGTIKVDTVTFTDAGVDKSVSISGLVQNPTFSGNITVTGTISGGVVRGGTVSGATVTGTAGQFTTATITSGVFASGTAAAPSIAFAGDLDTGLFTGAANTVGIAANGAAVLTVSGTNVGIGTTNPLEKFHVSGGPLLVAGELQGVRASSTALDYSSNSTRLIAMGPDVSTTSPILFLNGTSSSVTEKARFDSSGRLLIGATNARTLTTGGAGVNHKLQIETAGATSVFTTASIYSNSDVATIGAYLEIGRSKGTALGAVTAVASGDLLGEIRFAGTDGSASAQSSAIQGVVDAAVSSTKIAGRLNFLTTTNGETSPTVKMTIKNNGYIGIGTESPGLVSGLSRYLTLAATGSSEAPSFELWGNRSSSDQTSSRISFLNGAGANEIARINCEYQGGTTGSLAISTGGTERLRVTQSGNLFLGGTYGKIDSSTSIEIQTQSYLTLGQFSTGSAPGYLGWNITATSTAGIYKARITGDKASVLTLNSGGDLFYSAATTTQTAGNNLTNFGERVRFLNAGGITFNGDTAATNALDDYEEGSWTPSFSAGGITVSTVASATYTKIGNFVFIRFYVEVNAAGANGNDVVMTGLPFNGITYGYSPGVIDIGKGGKKGAYIRVESNSPSFVFLYSSESPTISRKSLIGTDIGTEYMIGSFGYMA